jgi:hypothetical protein
MGAAGLSPVGVFAATLLLGAPEGFSGATGGAAFSAGLLGPDFFAGPSPCATPSVPVFSGAGGTM